VIQDTNTSTWNAQINFYWFIERRDLLTSLTTAPPNNDPQDSHSEHACDNPNCAYIHTTHISSYERRRTGLTSFSALR
jgi:hypothetical protein